MSDAPALAIVGPTATGKTALAIEVSRRLRAEIVSVDSRQAYRGIAVGSAAPTAGEKAAVPHHGVDFVPPESSYSAGQFARLARGWISDIRTREAMPLLVGGTGFFLRALLSPVFREPPMDPERRARLREWLMAQPRGQVRRWAETLDRHLNRRLSTVDWQRAMRTIELAWLSGRPLSWWQQYGEPEAAPIRAAVFALELPADDHRTRIRGRLDECWDAWVEEVRALLGGGADPRTPGWSAVGYRELAAWLGDDRARRTSDRPAGGPEAAARDPEVVAGDAEAEVRERIEHSTWQYARRQRTWFRHQLPESAVWLDARLPTGQLADRIEEEWSRARTLAGC